MRTHGSIYNGDDKCPLPPGPIVSGWTGRAATGKGILYYTLTHMHSYMYVYVYICAYTAADIMLCVPIGSADSNMSKSPVRSVRPPPPPLIRVHPSRPRSVRLQNPFIFSSFFFFVLTSINQPETCMHCVQYNHAQTHTQTQLTFCVASQLCILNRPTFRNLSDCILYIVDTYDDHGAFTRLFILLYSLILYPSYLIKLWILTFLFVFNVYENASLTFALSVLETEIFCKY